MGIIIGPTRPNISIIIYNHLFLFDSANTRKAEKTPESKSRGLVFEHYYDEEELVHTCK